MGKHKTERYPITAQLPDSHPRYDEITGLIEGRDKKETSKQDVILSAILFAIDNGFTHDDVQPDKKKSVYGSLDEKIDSRIKETNRELADWFFSELKNMGKYLDESLAKGIPELVRNEVRDALSRYNVRPGAQSVYGDVEPPPDKPKVDDETLNERKANIKRRKFT